MLVPDPGFFSIPDPECNNKKDKEKKIVIYLSCSHKFYKIINYFIFEQVQRKMGSHRQKVFYQNGYYALKNMGLGSGVWDPGSDMREKTDPGSGNRGKKTPDQDTHSATLADRKKLFY
jgi:hypothetical protein